MRMNRRNLKILKQLIVLSLCISAFLGLYLLQKHGIGHRPKWFSSETKKNLNVQSSKFFSVYENFLASNLTVHAEISSGLKAKVLDSLVAQEKDIDRGDKVLRLDLFNEDAKKFQPNYRVHSFYYPWYGNPKHGGKYVHWNHQYLPHWNPEEAKKWRQDRHVPPDDIAASFYPLLGAYSSSSPSVVDCHMQMMRFAKIGVVVVSWYPAGEGDKEGLEPDFLVSVILNAAQKYELKVALHIEPFRNRSAKTMVEQLRYILDKYGEHPAFYRTSHGNKTNLPLLYIYDSYLIDSEEWRKIFSKSGSMSVRDTNLDAIFIGLLVENKHQHHILRSGFDGFYTYFATNRFTFGSTWGNWEKIGQWAKTNGLLFIPSVGPGYIDTEVRPWNAINTRNRLDGKYYRESFMSALNLKPEIVSITSFNEWHEGTQIEPAIEKKSPSRSYMNYGRNGPFYYLHLTREFVDKIPQGIR